MGEYKLQATILHTFVFDLNLNAFVDRVGIPFDNDTDILLKGAITQLNFINPV